MDDNDLLEGFAFQDLEITGLRARIKMLEAALEKFADDNNWIYGTPNFAAESNYHWDNMIDPVRLAQEALELQ